MLKLRGHLEDKPGKRTGTALKAACTCKGMGCKSSVFRHKEYETTPSTTSLLTMLKLAVYFLLDQESYQVCTRIYENIFLKLITISP